MMRVHLPLRIPQFLHLKRTINVSFMLISNAYKEKTFNKSFMHINMLPIHNITIQIKPSNASQLWNPVNFNNYSWIPRWPP